MKRQFLLSRFICCAKQIGKKTLRFPPSRFSEDNRFCFAELVLLHDWTGLNYREIIEIPIFSDLHCLSMSRLYHNFFKTEGKAK